MDVIPGGSSRAAYYDRNPSAKTSSFSTDALAPHATVVRWSYTVPASRKAFWEMLQARVMRIAAAGIPSRADVSIQYTPNGGAAAQLVDARIFTNNLGDTAIQALSNIGLLSAGDLIQAATSDSSSGGTTDMLVTAKYTEFDA